MPSLLVLFTLSSLALIISLRLCRFNDSPNQQSVIRYHHKKYNNNVM